MKKKIGNHVLSSPYGDLKASQISKMAGSKTDEPYALAEHGGQRAWTLTRSLTTWALGVHRLPYPVSQ